MILWNAERIGGHIAGIELPLRRGVDRKIAERIGHSRGRVRLDVTLVDRRRDVGALNDDIGLGEAFIDVTSLERHGVGDVRSEIRRVKLLAA